MTGLIGGGVDPALDRGLKAKHRAMWALGDYAAVAREVVGELGPRLVRATGIRPGERVLDVAAGTGNATIPAALAGADVTATDLTPELLEAGRQDAEKRGVRVEWQVADAEALPFPDGTFDVVVSCLGVMFAPHHAVAAAELVRVCRPGGRIGLVTWTPEGFVGQLFAAMKPYVPPPPPGVQPPPMWGTPSHVADLLGDRVDELETGREALDVRRFDTPEEFRDYFRDRYGPTIAAYRAIAADPERVRALDADLVELARRHLAGGRSMDWEYLLVTARRRG